MRATAAFTKLFIRGLAWDSEQSGVPFRDTLKTAARGKLTDSSKGKVLIGVTSGGTSSSYSLPPLGGLSADDLAEVCSQLLDQVDTLDAANDPVLGDDALVAELLRLSAPVYSTRPDFSALAR